MSRLLLLLLLLLLYFEDSEEADSADSENVFAFFEGRCLCDTCLKSAVHENECIAAAAAAYDAAMHAVFGDTHIGFGEYDSSDLEE
jgi:hypothetical protein